MIYGPGWVLEASTNGWCGTEAGAAANAQASAVALRELLLPAPVITYEWPTSEPICII